MKKRVGLHKMVYLNTEAMISTVELCEGLYETIVMFADGEDIERFRTNTLDDAKRVHNETMRRWNDKLYEGSIAKLLGAENLGQFVTPVVMC